MHGRTFFIVAALAAAILGAIGAGAIASTAQAGTPAICEQYPNLPICDVEPLPPPEPPEKPPDGGPGDEGGGGAGPTGDADGKLPFTGYPITDLLLLLLALLAAGVAIRLYLAARERLARGDTAS